MKLAVGRRVFIQRLRIRIRTGIRMRSYMMVNQIPQKMEADSESLRNQLAKMQTQLNESKASENERCEELAALKVVKKRCWEIVKKR